jgi:hypothetical protein
MNWINEQGNACHTWYTWIGQEVVNNVFIQLFKLIVCDCNPQEWHEQTRTNAHTHTHTRTHPHTHT